MNVNLRNICVYAVFLIHGLTKGMHPQHRHTSHFSKYILRKFTYKPNNY